MMKKRFFKTACCVVLFSVSAAAEQTDVHSEWLSGGEAEKRGGTEGGAAGVERGKMKPDLTLRTMWIDTQSGGIGQSATAVGGHFGLETAPFRGFSGYVGVQTSQKLWGINPSVPETVHPDLYGKNGESFTYISEAELRYEQDGLILRAGRMKVETPFADPDDLRMAYNTFEGAAAGYALSDTVTADLYYLSRWAGFDSGEAQSEFVKLAENCDGAAAAGVTYAPDDDFEASIWYYHVDRQYDLFYAEAVGGTDVTPELRLEWGVQAAQMFALDDSGIEGSVLGATGMLHYGDLYGGAAYNRAMVSGEDTVTDGFGGGPYFTSLDEATIAAASELVPGTDVDVYRVGAGIDLGRVMPETELNLEMVYGLFAPEANPASIAETDLLLWLETAGSLRVDMVFASFDVRQSAHPEFDDFERYYIRIDYAF